MSDKLLEKFLHELTTEYSHIRPMEEDDDAIEKSGLEAFKAGDFQLAEKRFKELAVSQPSHHSGLEYLALLYSRTGKFELAAAIQEEAIKIDLINTPACGRDGRPYGRRGPFLQLSASTNRDILMDGTC